MAPSCNGEGSLRNAWERTTAATGAARAAHLQKLELRAAHCAPALHFATALTASVSSRGHPEAAAFERRTASPAVAASNMLMASGTVQVDPQKLDSTAVSTFCTIAIRDGRLSPTAGATLLNDGTLSKITLEEGFGDSEARSGRGFPSLEVRASRVHRVDGEEDASRTHLFRGWSLSLSLSVMPGVGLVPSWTGSGVRAAP